MPNEVRSTSRTAASPARRVATVLLVVAALAGGVGVGRFALSERGPDGGALGSGATADDAPPGRSLTARVAELEMRVSRDPDDVSAWQSLGAVYVRRAAEVGDPSFYGLAERAFGEADARLPGDPGTLIGRGTLALALHQFADALALGTQAVEKNPASASALGVVVDAQVELGHYDDAAAALQRMLDLRPDLPALARTSYLRELHGDLPGALAAMRQAEVAGAGSSFDVATVASLLGDLHLKERDLDRAGAAYDRALAASPGLVTAEVGRARVLAATGRGAEAESALGTLVDRVPYPPALMLLTELQQRRGDEAAAQRTGGLVRAVTRLQEEAGQVVDLEMALFEADRGDPTLALDLATRAHAARPDNVFVNDALGWALLRDGQAAGAVPYVEAAVRLGSLDPGIRFHAAEVFAAVGDTARARGELERGLALTPATAFRYADEAAALAARLGLVVPT